MDQIIRLRKFSWLTALVAVALIDLLGRGWTASAAEAAVPTFQLMRNIGVIPLQAGSIDALQDLNASRTFVEGYLGGAVRASKRFVVIDDDFVKVMWSTPEGRQELTEDHELHAFVSLEIQLREDTILWYCRLLSPKLQTNLIESDSMSRYEFGTATKETLGTRLDNLVFRMFNRLPIDTTITSIQGKYVTLSGGQEQGINNQDEFVIERVSVATTHPATGAWLKYHRQVVGRVKVIEVKNTSAIAEVTQMTSNDSMSLGDGAKIPDLASRLKFKRLRAESPTAATDAKPIPTTPLYDTGAKTFEPKAGKSIVYEDLVVEPSGGDAKAVDNSNPDPDQPSNIMGIVSSLVDYGYLDAGFRFWKISGAASAAAGSFPVNTFQVTGGKKFIEETFLEFGGYFSFGSNANKGGFQGFGGSARLLYSKELSGDIKWFASAVGGLNSLGVTGRSFGGYDLVYGGASGGVTGSEVLGEARIDWLAELELRPFHIGQLGAGGLKTVESSMVTILRLKAFQNLGVKNVEWGGIIESASGTYSLQSSDIKYSDFTMLGSARVRF